MSPNARRVPSSERDNASVSNALATTLGGPAWWLVLAVIAALLQELLGGFPVVAVLVVVAFLLSLLHS